MALLIATLIFSATECVASCANQGCNAAVPPCHQHEAPAHETAPACPHDFVLPGAQTWSVAHIPLIEPGIGLPLAAVASNLTLLVVKISISSALSPPDPILLSASILRI
ncbi:MAG: hypothetical protein JOZ32_04305 [Bryobacterales bacterium]|nr:hypothetical protein [Bryobacterales bacterium]